jgi:hypothetical protein
MNDRALAVAAALLLAPGAANADVFAFARAQIGSPVIAFSGNIVPDFAISTAGLTNTAGVAGGPGAATAAVGGATRVDALRAVFGTGPFSAENDFDGFFVTGASSARADGLFTLAPAPGERLGGSSVAEILVAGTTTWQALGTLEYSFAFDLLPGGTGELSITVPTQSFVAVAGGVDTRAVQALVLFGGQLKFAPPGSTAGPNIGGTCGTLFIRMVAPGGFDSDSCIGEFSTTVSVVTPGYYELALVVTTFVEGSENPVVTPVPAPSALAILGLGALAAALSRRNGHGRRDFGGRG